jgi:hypothetical protein
MRISKSVALIGALIAATSMFVEAAPLKVVKVSGSTILSAIPIFCNSTRPCTTVDTVAQFSWQTGGPIAPSASLLSRTVTFIRPLKPTLKRTVYFYRLVALGGSSTECVTKVVMDFGPVTQIDYDHSGTLSDVVVVVVKNAPPPIAGVTSADQVGNTITINFSPGICKTLFDSSYFFGLAADTLPQAVKVQAIVYGGLGTNPISVDARVPMH